MSTVDRIRQYRLAHACSLMEAKNAVEKEMLMTEINKATDIEEIKIILTRIVQDKY